MGRVWLTWLHPLAPGMLAGGLALSGQLAEARPNSLPCWHPLTDESDVCRRCVKQLRVRCTFHAFKVSPATSQVTRHMTHEARRAKV